MALLTEEQQKEIEAVVGDFVNRYELRMRKRLGWLYPWVCNPATATPPVQFVRDVLLGWGREKRLIDNLCNAYAVALWRAKVKGRVSEARMQRFVSWWSKFDANCGGRVR